MKDKRAMRVKRKRQLAKKAERDKFASSLHADMKAAMKEHGLKLTRSKDELYREYQRERFLCFKKSIMVAMLCTMMCLHRDFGWGCERLWRLFDGTTALLTAVGNGDREIDQLADELRLDAGCDIKAMFADYKPWGGEEADRYTELKRSKNGTILANAVPSMVLVLFELYNKFGWKAKRMNRIAEAVKDAYVYFTEADKLEELKSRVEDELKIKLTWDGEIRMKG